MDKFDYEKKIFGNLKIDKDSKNLGGLRVVRCLDAIGPVRGRILEVGCGAGHFLRAIKNERPDLEIHGFDISKNSINVARSYNDGIIYSVASAGYLPYKDCTFDAVIVFDVLEHLPEVETPVREINRVLKDDGIFHGFVPCEGQPLTIYWLLWKFGLFYRVKERLAGHIQRFTTRGVLNLMERNGLDCIDKSYSFHFFGELLDFLIFLMKDIQSRGKVNQAAIAASEEKRGRNPVRWLERKWEIFRYYESRLLKRFPASGVHLTCRKDA